MDGVSSTVHTGNLFDPFPVHNGNVKERHHLGVLGRYEGVMHVRRVGKCTLQAAQKLMFSVVYKKCAVKASKCSLNTEDEDSIPSER